MRYLKIIAVLLVLAYIGRVVYFETWLGITQPESDRTMRITTFDADGEGHDRILTQIWVDDELYVGVNHWPRMWYRRLLDNPGVEITMDGETRPYRAVPVEGETFERVDQARPLSLSFRFKAGFPPRRIVHLEPLEHEGAEAVNPD
ncbi:MAG: hypothetical protein JJU22_01395 [Gammaproteobacteria bacterium]|jgi:hypothetical protein|nr:hypothetical protein [Gammaproteobacteria bacterium]